jgi:integrase
MSDTLPAPIQGGAKLPLRPMHVWGIRVRLQVQHRVRDLALFDIALDSKLRGCDVVSLRIGDVFAGNAPRKRGAVIQQKTGRPVQFEITEQARQSLAAWLERSGGAISDWLFPSRPHPGQHLSTRQYARLLKQWVGIIGLEPSGFGTHSLRRTKVCLLYRKTGNLRACQLLLGHTKLESTVRYLGVEVDDALQLSEGLEL